MEQALRTGKLSDAIAEAGKLSPRAAAPAAGWLDKVKARAAIDKAITGIEGELKSSLGAGAGKPTRKARYMLRLVLFLIAVAAVAGGLSWLADRPGSLVINWQGYEVETSVFRAVVILALLIGSRRVVVDRASSSGTARRPSAASSTDAARRAASRRCPVA